MMVCMTRQWMLAATRPTRYLWVSLPDHKMRPRRSTVLNRRSVAFIVATSITRRTREAQVRQEREDEVSDHLREYSVGEETIAASRVALRRAIEPVSD